ncbi:MAG: TonB family protein [Verrucomicrobia bacterium]|nr:TonB family protein [Verrucomicrobiota bacterium]
MRKLVLVGVVLLAGCSAPRVADKQSQVDYSLLSIQELTAKAEKGDANAQTELGFCYAIGKRVTKDEVEALKWYRKAAKQNSTKRLSIDFKPKQYHPTAKEVASPSPQQPALLKTDAAVLRREPTALNVVGIPEGSYGKKMFAEIGRHWTLLMEQYYADGQPGKVKLNFTLYPTGRVDHLKVAQNTASPMLGRYCQKAVIDCVPFDPWPQEMKLLGDHFNITIDFNVYSYEK